MQNEHVPQERAQLEHLNRVLRALRNVNQLIVREKDRERLIRRACELLVETHGFNGAWIALPGEPPAPIIAAQSGFPQAVFADHIQRIERGDVPTCMRHNQAGETVVLTENTPLSCADCPLTRFYDGATALTACLAHEEETYGWLGVSVPSSFATDPEERDLLAEIAGDLGFALHAIKQDEQHWQIVDALSRSEAQYRLLAENSVDVIWQMDLRLRFTYASPSVYTMTGYTPEEWVGTKLSQHATFTEFMKMARKAVSALKNYKTIKSIVFEAVLLKKDGSSFPVEISSKLVFNEQGLPIGLQGSTRDITERVRAETERQQVQETLHASEASYRRLFESAKDGILILDAESGMILDVNPFLVELLGFSHKQFLGKAIWELGAFTDIVANQTNFVELQQKEYIRYEDMPLETAAGQRIHVEFVSNVYQVNHRRVIQCNIRDITARKQAEAQLNEQLDELRRWHAATLGREGRVMELKREVNVLLAQAGQPPRYASVETENQ